MKNNSKLTPSVVAQFNYTVQASTGQSEAANDSNCFCEREVA